MKTSVELDEEKVRLAKSLSNSSTLKELLNRALDAFIAQSRRLEMASMLGTNFFKDDLKKMRGSKERGRADR
jgi:hypothetical protein